MAVQMQNTKFVSITPPAAIVDNAAYTTTEIDTLGFDYCTVVLYLGATDIAMAACKITESDVTASGHADVTGLDTDGDTNIDGDAATLPTATDDNKFCLFEIDLRGRKRFLDLSISAGNGTAGTYAAAFAILSRAKDTPVTIAERGAFEILRV